MSKDNKQPSKDEQIKKLKEQLTKAQRTNRILSNVGQNRLNQINQLEVEVETYKDMLQNQAAK